MPLVLGSTLGPYQILSSLGEGGMGEVYRAHDTRLDREVAVKILRADRVIDEQRKHRFIAEAHAASALNHPNIVTIHDIGNADGVDFLVMEYVLGKTLDQLIERKRMRVSDILRYAIQIADALSTAHAAGIVHGDIKPGNVMVNENGAIKVLDFGLAKLVEPEEFAPNTSTRTLSEEGVIVGTVAYMSPEQAEGKKLDARSDIFSFGVVVYEMVTGRRPFQGDSPLSTLAAVLHEDPLPVTQLADYVPRDLEKIIARCLRKNPSQRYQLLDDVRIALEDVTEYPVEAVQSEIRRGSRRWYFVAGIAVAALVAGFALAYLLRAREGVDQASLRYTPLATEVEVESSPSWSPDGKALAYVAALDGVSQVFIRILGAPISAQITRFPSECSAPFWSPDGTRIYFHSAGDLWSVGAAGGSPTRVMENVVSSAVSRDGKTLVFSRGEIGTRSLWTAGVGSQPETYRAKPFPESFVSGGPHEFSPDGSKILVMISQRAPLQSNELWILPYPSGTPRRVLPSLPATAVVQRVVWMPDSRHLVFDANATGISGAHLYQAEIETGTIGPLTSSTANEEQPSVSPDGSKIAFTSGGTDFDLFDVPLNGDPIRPLLATSRNEDFPAWAPSGVQYAYSTNASGNPELWLRSVQEGWARPVVMPGPQGLTDWYRLEAPAFSPDGRQIAYDVYSPQHEVWVSRVAGGRAARVDSNSQDQHRASWSPDGKWICYRREQAGKWELVKMPFGGGTAVVLVEDVASGGAGGGNSPWSPSGDVIAFRKSGPGLHLVSSNGGRTRQLTTYTPEAYGFSRDGSTLYAIRRLGNRKWAATQIDVSSGKEGRTIELAIPVAGNIAGFSLHLDGKRFATGIGIPKSDIWLLEGFRQPRRRGWAFLRTNQP